jgi:hypothetical protein
LRKHIGKEDRVDYNQDSDRSRWNSLRSVAHGSRLYARQKFGRFQFNLFVAWLMGPEKEVLGAYTMRMRVLLPSIFVLWMVSCGLLFAQKKGAGQGTGSNQSPGGSPSQNGSQQPSQQSTNSPGGITSGGEAIESTLFSYKALTADAQAISQEISNITNDHDLIVIMMPTDTAAFVQWRTVLQQLHLLQARVGDRPLSKDMNLPKCSNAKAAPQRPRGPGEAYVASTQDIQTLVQTLATMFAVNESAAPSAGAITDVPLVNGVARDLSAFQLNVYVPSLYPPALFHRDDLTDTFIGKDLQSLERARFDITSDIQAFQSAPDTAALIARQGVTPDCTADDVRQARTFQDTRSSEMRTLVTSDTALVAAIDTFEASLFTGQSPAPQGNNANQNQPGSQGPQPAAGSANPNPAPNQNPNQTPNSPVPPLNFSSAPGSILQQILPADLLAYKIWQANSTPDDTELGKLHFLVLHALESGGTQLSKSNLFLGTRVYFSGGSIATFSMFTVGGAVECAGYAYDYSGDIREKNVEKELRVSKSDGAVLDVAFPCQ